LKESGKSENMISVQVGDHDGHGTVETESRVHHLALGSFAAIEQEEFSISTESYCWQASFFGGKTAPGAEEYDIDTSGHLVCSQN
jgi:hypothetical protein